MNEQTAVIEDRWGLLGGERKLVTVMFADIVKSSHLVVDKDPEEANAILLSALQVMVDSVHRFDGVVTQVLGDGIMAVFGAPVAQENHAIRACLAADAMQAAMKDDLGRESRGLDHGMAIRVGLNSGEVVAHVVSGDAYPGYRAVGETVHLASRLESVARPGCVVVAGSTLKLVAGQVEVRPIAPVSLATGHAVECFELVKVVRDKNTLRSLASKRNDAFVGRQDDTKFLCGLFNDAKQENGKAAVVTGDAGVGKSRLVLEFLESIAPAESHVVECSLLPTGIAVPQEWLAGVVRSLLLIDHGQTIGQIRENACARLKSLDIPEKDALASILSVMRIDPGSADWSQLDPQERQQLAIDTVTRVILATSRLRPVIVVIDDFHWADTEARSFANALASRLASSRVLLIVTARPRHGEAWANWPNVAERQLSPLSARYSSKLLQVLLGRDPSLDELKDVLIKKTQGIPFFIEECVHTLEESGALDGSLGAYRLVVPIETIQIPPTIHGALAARIDALSTAIRSVLLCASVIGQRFDVGLLRDLTGIPEQTLLGQLDQLQNADFVQRTRIMPNLEYSFRHALVHDVAYETLLRRRRLELHARLTEAIEKRRAARLPDKIELLAHHAFRAEAWPKAFVYGRRAGQRAQSKSRNREAVEFFKNALHALEVLPRTRRATERSIDTRLDLAQSLFLLGERNQGHAQLLNAQRMAGHLHDDRRLARAASERTLYQWIAGNTLQAICTGRMTLEIATKLNDIEFEILSAVRFGALLMDHGDYEPACQLLRPAIARIPNQTTQKRFGLLATASVASRATLAATLGQLGRFREALQVGDDAIRIADEVGHAFSQIYALVWVSNVLLKKGDFERSVPHLERSFALCESTRTKLLYPLASASLGYAYVRTGKASRGLALLEKSVRIAQEQEWLSRLPLKLCWLSESYFLLGRMDQAIRTAVQALDLARNQSEVGQEAWILSNLGEIHANLPNSCNAKSADFFNEAMSIANDRHMTPLVAHCHLGLSKFYSRERARDEAKRQFQAAQSIYCKRDMKYWFDRTMTEASVYESV